VAANENSTVSNEQTNPLVILRFKILTYKDLSFNVFNIINIENKVKAKYKTKNNITEGNPVFLATKNHIRATTSSRRNLSVTATSECMVWAAGSRLRPLKNIRRVTRAMNERDTDRSAVSVKLIPIPGSDIMNQPAARTIISRRTRS
jgi:hypothetical protein